MSASPGLAILSSNLKKIFSILKILFEFSFFRDTPFVLWYIAVAQGGQTAAREVFYTSKVDNLGVGKISHKNQEI